MGLIIAGFIFFLLSLGLFYLSFKEKGKLAKIQETRTSTARELITPGKPGVPSVGQKSKVVEVKGIIRTEKPLAGPISKKPCVYFIPLQSNYIRLEPVEKIKRPDNALK